jgi:hypothetical protein
VGAGCPHFPPEPKVRPSNTYWSPWVPEVRYDDVLQHWVARLVDGDKVAPVIYYGARIQPRLHAQEGVAAGFDSERQARRCARRWAKRWNREAAKAAKRDGMTKWSTA